METVWAENKAKLPQDLIRKTLGRVLGSVYETGEQDKYRAAGAHTDGHVGDLHQPSRHDRSVHLVGAGPHCMAAASE